MNPAKKIAYQRNITVVNASDLFPTDTLEPATYAIWSAGLESQGYGDLNLFNITAVCRALSLGGASQILAELADTIENNGLPEDFYVNFGK